MANVLAGTVLGAYGLAGRAAVPLLPLALAWRARRGKEDRARLGERFGRASLARPAGRVAWIHAASVGETNAILPLVEKIVECGIGVVFTSVTVTSAKIAGPRLPVGAIHQFAPIDAPPLIARFLDHWRPEFALFVESELWPTTIVRLAASGTPQILVNARLSERSFRGWQRAGGVGRSIFARIPLCLAQSARDAERYEALGAPSVVVTGNLKFDAPAPDADANSFAEFRKATIDRTVWVAASTHEGEDSFAAEAHRLLSDRFANLLTIVVPRHPERGDAIRAELTGSGRRVAQRSRAEVVGPTTEIYIADTLGELGLFYRAAPIAFLGGSLVPHGGQNPIEPVRLGCAVLHGPHVHNFTDIYAAIDDVGQLPPVVDAQGLAAALAELLSDADGTRCRIGKVAEALEPFSGAVAATMSALKPYTGSGAAV